MELDSRSVRAIALTNRVLTITGYIAYPVLLIALAVWQPSLLTREILVPAIGFVAVSVFRNLYNAPRPYEVSGKPPLIPKSTKGKSFPSRHTFCMFMIAMGWLRWIPVVGMALISCGCIMAVMRVMLGVHYPKDVIAGALIAILFGIIGFWAIP